MVFACTNKYKYRKEDYKMYSIKYDENKNRIYTKLEGFIKKDEAEAYMKDGFRMHKQVKPGFTFLVDIRDLKTLPQESLEYIQKTREDGVKNGAKLGATIISETDNILKNQTQRTAKKVNGFEEIYFTSIEEAEAFLNKNI